MLTLISAILGVAGAAFTVGAYVERRIGTEKELMEAHRHVHRDVVELKNSVNGETGSRVSDCPLCEQWEC